MSLGTPLEMLYEERESNKAEAEKIEAEENQAIRNNHD